MRRQSRRKDVRLHHRPVQPGQWVILQGMPVTRPSRIAADLLDDKEDPEAVAHVIADAIRSIYDYPGTFADALAHHAARFGLRRGDGLALLRWLLDLVGDPESSRWMAEAGAHVARSSGEHNRAPPYGALAGELDRALPELQGERCGHDGHPSRWPTATSGQVSGKRGEAQVTGRPSSRTSSTARYRCSTTPSSTSIRRPPHHDQADRSEADSTQKNRQPARSVAHLPELLSASYRNRVRKLSPRNRNQRVQHLPGPHTRRQQRALARPLARQGSRNAARQRLRWSEGMITGGVEPPTFRFSGVAITLVLPRPRWMGGGCRASAVGIGCRRCRQDHASNMVCLVAVPCRLPRIRRPFPAKHRVDSQQMSHNVLCH